jgi:hypothetical protein
MGLHRASLTLLCALVAGAASVADADDAPRFAICSAILGDTAPGHAEGMARPHLVNVLLNDDGTKQLKAFTAAHLGSTVQVVVDSTVLSSVPVQVVVDSGRMQFGFQTQSEAEAALTRITTAPREPCGALPSN